jgi:enterochelin esterase family protein
VTRQAHGFGAWSILEVRLHRSLALLALVAVVSLACACSSDGGGFNPLIPGAAGASGGASVAGAANSAGASSVGGAVSAGSAGSPEGGSVAGQPGGAGSAGALGAAGNVGADDPGTDGDGMFSIAGPWKTAPEFTRAAGVAKGKTFTFTFAASDSKIYPKAVDRKVVVYVPTQYKAGTPAAVMVVQDGTDFYGFDSAMPPVFDNLIAAGKIPPVVCVFVGNGGGDYIGSERGLEYDTVSGMYATWVDSELLPRVELESKTAVADQAVTFTKNPEGRAALGGSSGGAASFSMVWWRQDLFRRLITFSGTYVNQVANGTPFKHGAWIYHDIDPYKADVPNGLIVASCEKATGSKTSGEVEPCDTPTSKSACEAVSGCAWNDSRNKSIRIWHEAGTNDNGAGDDPSSYRNFHLANQRMAQSFKARGYHYHYDDAQGAGHVDQGPLRQTLPTALTWLWRGYKAGT